MGIMTSTSQRKCVYCGSHLRADARGCRACNRWQPKKGASNRDLSPFLVGGVLAIILVLSSVLFVSQVAHNSTSGTPIDAIRAAEQLAANCHSSLNNTVIDAMLVALHDEGDDWQKSIEVSTSIACSSGSGTAAKSTSSVRQVPQQQSPPLQKPQASTHE